MLLQVILVVIFSAIGSTLLILGLLCIEYIVFKLRVKVKDKYFKELKKENNFEDFCCNNIRILVCVFSAVWLLTFVVLLDVQFDNIYVEVDCREHTEIVESEERALKNLSMTDSYRGDIFVVAGYGSGNMDSEITYKYFEQNDDGSYELKQISASKVKIIETDEEIPKIKKIKYATGNWFKDEPTRFGKMLFAKEREGWKNYKEVEDIIIYVPIGGIDNIQ